jgi:hypothetical protein
MQTVVHGGSPFDIFIDQSTARMCHLKIVYEQIEAGKNEMNNI